MGRPKNKNVKPDWELIVSEEVQNAVYKAAKAVYSDNYELMRSSGLEVDDIKGEMILMLAEWKYLLKGEPERNLLIYRLVQAIDDWLKKRKDYRYTETPGSDWMDGPGYDD